MSDIGIAISIHATSLKAMSIAEIGVVELSFSTGVYPYISLFVGDPMLAKDLAKAITAVLDVHREAAS